MITLTEPLLRRLFPDPDARDGYIAALIDGERLLTQAGVNATPLRMAHFLAQVSVETGDLTVMEESGNYSAERLLAVFPTHFTRADAARYAHKPKAALSRAYANRMGNRGEASGDGWRYRGRGFNQLTGTDNYREYGEALNIDLLGNPELAADPRVSLKIALREWSLGDLNRYADADDALSIRRWINCGSHTKGKPNGLAHAKAALARMKADLGRKFAPEIIPAQQPEALAEALAASPELVRATPHAGPTVIGARNAGDRRIAWLDRAQSLGNFLGLGGALGGTAGAVTLPSVISAVRGVYEPFVGDMRWLATAWPALIVVGAVLAFAAWRAKQTHVAAMEAEATS